MPIVKSRWKGLLRTIPKRYRPKKFAIIITIIIIIRVQENSWSLYAAINGNSGTVYKLVLWKILVSTVNYLSFIDGTYFAAKQHETIQDRPPKKQKETYLGLPINQSTKCNLYIWQRRLAQMSSLHVLGATEW